LKVDPKKENPFNPEESVDLQGIQGRLFNIPMLEFNQLFVKQILISRESGMIPFIQKRKNY
jgi:hypothetical protein